jgi:hypothetical protein
LALSLAHSVDWGPTAAGRQQRKGCRNRFSYLQEVRMYRIDSIAILEGARATWALHALLLSFQGRPGYVQHLRNGSTDSHPGLGTSTFAEVIRRSRAPRSGAQIKVFDMVFGCTFGQLARRL